MPRLATMSEATAADAITGAPPARSEAAGTATQEDRANEWGIRASRLPAIPLSYLPARRRSVTRSEGVSALRFRRLRSLWAVQEPVTRRSSRRRVYFPRNVSVNDRWQTRSCTSPSEYVIVSTPGCLMASVTLFFAKWPEKVG